MAINRFYSPQRSQYVSQFVPNQLPTELMMGMLANKQKQEDDKQGFLAEARLVDWNVVPGAIVDEAKKKQMLSEIHTKADEFATKDITKDPAAFNQYKTFIRGLKNNEEIKSMTSYYDQYTKFQEEYQKMLQDPSKIGGGEAMYKQLREWDESYIKGQGYKGKGYQGLSEVRAAFDIDDNLRETFGALKADKREWEKLGEFIKTGGSWEGITSAEGGVNSRKDGKITAATKRHFLSWRQGPIGKAVEDIVDQQLGLTFAKKQQILSNPESKQEYEKIVNETLYARAMAVGQDYEVEKTSNKESDRSQGAIQREQESKAMILNLGMVSKGIDPEALINSYDESKNGIVSTANKLKEAYKDLDVNVNNLFRKDGTVNPEEYTKLRNQLITISKNASDADKQSISNELKSLEKLKYNTNYVADTEEYGKYMVRASKEAVTKVASFWGINSEEIAKYIDNSGNLDTSPLLEKVISTGIGDKISSSSTLGYQLKMAFSASMGNNELVLPKNKDAYANVAKEVANSKFLQADLINSGMTPEEVKLFIKAYGAEGGKDSRGGKHADRGLDLFDNSLQENKSIWQKHYKHNKSNEPVTDSSQEGVVTESTQRMRKAFNEGNALTFKVLGTDKVVTIQKNEKLGNNMQIYTDLKRLDPNGNYPVIISQTVNKDGDYFDVNTQKTVSLGKDRAGEVISTTVYSDAPDSKQIWGQNTTNELYNAAATTKSPQEAQLFIEGAVIQEANLRPVDEAGNLYTWIDGFIGVVGQTKNVPVKISVGGNQYKVVKGLDVKTVSSATGDQFYEVMFNGEKQYSGITNKGDLQVAINEFTKRIEASEQAKSGGNIW